ncbi:MAG: ATP-binding cassette domain-containing protein [Candidatus Hydrogenedentes bacterium]|nr:ATP-binding cassette domain-containing protein [Candidatus Hydrogenedentota bacterium]
MDQPASLAIDCLSHGFGTKPVLHDVQLRILRGQIVALVGPSGCGKSTLLRAIVGTHLPRQGTVTVFSGNSHLTGHVVEGPGRDRGIVYQHYSLFPFLTAVENVAFGLMLDQTNISYRLFKFPRWLKRRAEHLKQAREFLDRVGLGSAASLYPSEMSGGMCQRVAVAQALIMKPALLLLDEPFGALDEAMREELQRMLLGLYQENLAARRKGELEPHTMFIVTHELNEALYVGDRVVGLSQYWDWRQAGHAQPPGATVVYDCSAPIFEPDDTRDFSCFAGQREEIRDVVFNPDSAYPREKHLRYWQELEQQREAEPAP